ncbi:MAG: SH3 domain-containing protein [Candidatus Hermodarchaeota archaeon]
MKGKRCRVIENYESPYTESWTIVKGEILTVGEKDTEWMGWIWCTNKEGESRWVPENYLEIHGNTGKANQDYNATELSVKIGEELIIKKEEAEWFWVTNQQGQKGWVPIRNVQIFNNN